MKAEDIDTIAPWIISIHYRNGNYVAHVFPGKIVEALTFGRLYGMIAATIATDIIAIIADYFNIDYDRLRRPESRGFEYSDARIIIAYILRQRYNFSYRLIKGVLRYKSNQSIRRVDETIENSFVLQQKLEKVYKAYPFLKDNKIEIKTQEQ